MPQEKLETVITGTCNNNNNYEDISAEISRGFHVLYDLWEIKIKGLQS